nr:thaumatin-like protein PWIR2 [Oryza sativa Japonica Group]
MEFGRSPALLLLVGFLWSQLQFGAESAGTTVFTLRNNCTYTVWPTTLSGNTAVAIGGGGFELSLGANVSFPAPDGWSGRLWARTDCAPSGTASLACATGDFGGVVSCSLGGAPPVTLAEFTLGSADGKDLYDVSLVGRGRRGSPRATPPPAARALLLAAHPQLLPPPPLRRPPPPSPPPRRPSPAADALLLPLAECTLSIMPESPCQPICWHHSQVFVEIDSSRQ